MQGTNTGGVAPRPPSAKPRRGMRRYATAAAPFLVVGALVYGGMNIAEARAAMATLQPSKSKGGRR